MTKASKIILVVGFVCTLIFTSCSKKEIQEVDNETQSVIDYGIADQEFISLISTVYQSLVATKGTGAPSTNTLVTCDALSYISGDTGTFAPNAVYMLNVSGSTCDLLMADTKVRSGNLIMRLTGKIKKDSKVIIKLMNYNSENISYSCDSLILTTLEATTSYASFNAVLINGSCKTGTATIKYRFNRTFTVYPKGAFIGESPVSYIYGEASGTNRQGTNFSTNVSQDSYLVKHKTCRYIDKGIMELTPEGFKTRTIDFGNGTCDDEATFTVKENTVAFKLK